MYKLKILIVGPCAYNIRHQDVKSSEPKPKTKNCQNTTREFGDCGKTTISNFLSDATEISSGDYRPTQGVRILEFEAQNLNVNNRHLKAEVELWDCSGDHKFESCWPAIQKDTQGIIFVYNPSTPDHQPSTFSRVTIASVNVEESGNRLRADFNNFLATVIDGLRDRSEQEELNIMNMQSA
ncbi:Intraflagellar transport protein 22 [Blattella germanica]|nr:Intraflagellar transport protein 22 [Blattella germanica]